MNPFDWRGPAFLAFYAVLAVVVLALMERARRRAEGGRRSQVELDPFQVAFLRGGTEETIRTAVISLVDRGLLRMEGALVVTDRERSDQARRPLERTILEALIEPTVAYGLMGNRAVVAEAESIGQTVAELGLIPDTRQREYRRRILGMALATLWLTAGVKITIALSRHRHNVLFLMGMLALATGVAFWMTMRRRTADGDAQLAQIRKRYAGLRDRIATIAPGGQTSEVAFAAAAFGAAAIAPLAHVPVEALFPRAVKQSAAVGSGCGSSCTGGGGGCGGSCGGGCGGGCGGCGS